MKAGELRIGNYYKGSLEFKGSVEAELIMNESREFILTDKILLLLLQLDLTAFVEPIPLTEEWLVKFGFEKDESIQQGFSYVLDLKGRIKIVFYEGDVSCLSLFQDDKLIDFPVGTIKYVHQLQNHYFTLTGEELVARH